MGYRLWLLRLEKLNDFRILKIESFTEIFMLRLSRMKVQFLIEQTCHLTSR